MNKIFKTLLVIFVLFITQISFAGEGMWLPHLLRSLNEAEMKGLGMKMSAEDIYSVNKGSLKDAIVHFNGGCTSEIISASGLLLTNHHCGYSQIQSHSTVDKNYLKDGFWAMKQSEELPNAGLYATFIERIEDVSEAILTGVTDKMSNKERQSQIDKNIAALKKNTKVADYEEIMVKPFYKGNQYFLFVTRTYTDVRLVGAPPESIGKFGSDTDNWVWPRHTGDFSLFRIYAGPDNLPAEYSDDNVPFKPKHFLPISVDGVAEGDFTLVFGFPGRTNQYLPSPAVEQLVDVINPERIAIRDHALKIIDVEMRKDEMVRLQYASKFARVANYWKKWIGESQGLKSTKAIDKKKKVEAEFQEKLKTKKAWSQKYGNLLSDFEERYTEIEPYALSRDYYGEVVNRNIEIMRIVTYMNRLVTRFEENGETAYQDYKGRLSNYLKGFYKDYQPSIDQKVFADLMDMYAEEKGIKGVAKPIVEYKFQRKLKSTEALAKYLYENSFIPNEAALFKTLDLKPEEAIAAIQKDPFYTFGNDLKKAYDEKVSAQYDELSGQIADLQRSYMAALMEVFPNRRFYPDANSTMRVTYGQVNGYQPRDAVTYTPVTYLEGVMEKYKPGDYEFDVPQKLQELYDSKDYGTYGEKGKMPICFLGSNHTTGGNSGSPAIDAYGNLIGLNFDRVWEGTMSDINYDKSICRNIMVDVRYILFIVDKYAGAGHLIKEMKLVHPKKKLYQKADMKIDNKSKKNQFQRIEKN